MSEINLQQQSGWADLLIDSVGDSSLSNSSVVNWLQNNLGILNLNIRSEFYLGESGVILPGMNSVQSGIYNEFFFCSWLQKKARTSIGAMAVDWIEMEGEDQGRIKVVSNLQKGQSYNSMAKDCNEHLKSLCKTYKGGDFATPQQITFNERVSTPANVHCIPFDWSDYNPIRNILSE